MDQLEELHPVRYAQVPHAALDGLPDLNSIGMLSIMLRHKPNFPFTVERVIKQKKAIPGPKLGETVAYGAMTTLIQHRWAARVKFRCAGGHMHTSIFRTATQFTLDDYREICGRFGAGTEKILHCKGCSDDPKIPVRTTIRTGASLQWEKDTSKNGTPIADLFAPGGPLATATGPRIPGTGVTSGDAPVPSFPGTGAPGPGTPGTFKNTSGEQEGEEGDTRARATGESSDGDEPIIWGVAGGADFVAPKRVSADLIREIAGKALLPGEHLDVEDHQRLASLVEAVRPVVEAQKGLSWEEYVAWLKQGWVRPDGRRAFKTLPGALSWRLQPEQVKKQAWGWACEQRGAQEASEAQGERDTPQPRGGARTGACGVHGVETFEGNCAVCDKETAEEARRYAAAQAASQEPPVPDDFADEGQEPEDLDPEVLRQMEADLEAKAAAARERRERELAATKALFSKVRSGAATEEAARR